MTHTEHTLSALALAATTPATAATEVATALRALTLALACTLPADQRLRLAAHLASLARSAEDAERPTLEALLMDLHAAAALVG